jgi:hypothetical protein
VLLTLIGNESYGDLRGFEGAGIANVRSGAVDGAQASIVFGSAREVRGAQAAGVVAHSSARVQGFQGAIALALASGPVEGVQMGAVSLAGGEVQGAQAAIALNLASGGVEGAQAGVLNLAPSVSGAQIGLVNIGGRVRGTQVGLVNIAESVDGLPVGVVNVVGDSRTQALAWADTHGFAYGGVKYLHAPLYTLIALGAELSASEGTNAHRLAADTGLGVHAQAGPWFGALDVVYSFQGLPDPPTGADPDRHFLRYRLTGGYDYENLVGLFAGIGLEHEIAGESASFGPFGLAGIQIF